MAADDAPRRRFVAREDKRVTRAYYNENDYHAAQWLQAAIAAGALPDGDVDGSDIRDITPDDLKGYTQCHFFAGIGGWPLALHQVGWPDDRPVWTGSCPCQPWSPAGKRLGAADERDLWPDFYRLIQSCRPEVVFGEQVASSDVIGPAKPSRKRVQAADRGAWLDTVFDDLEAAHYACAAIPFPAAGIGAPMLRDRLYWLADAEGGEKRWARERCQVEGRASRGRGADDAWSDIEWIECSDGWRRPTQPGLWPLASRAPAHLERIRGYGNAICVPAASAFISAYLDLEAAA